MRYMFVRVDETSVTLLRETEYVNSYIELQKIVMQNPYSSKSIWTREIISWLNDAAHTFIENVLTWNRNDWRSYYWNLTENLEGLIDFRVKINLTPKSKIKDRTSGIGLPNVIRRLNLLYDQKHIFDK